VTVLASYTFPPTANLANVVVRGYFAGRYLNNTGSTFLPNLSLIVNGQTLVTQSFQVQSNAVAYSFAGWAHFGVNTTVQATGNNLSVAPVIDVSMALPMAGQGYVGNAGGVATPYVVTSIGAFGNTIININQTTTFEVDFIITGLGDVLEPHIAYLEAL